MPGPPRRRAILMLLCATAAWGFSFPAGKALMTALADEVPMRSTWFYSSVVMCGRFGLAALLLWLFQPSAWARLTPREWRQGIGLGLFGGLGMMVQTDGLAHTAASTSAFLTQFAAVLIPLFVILRDRRLPSLRTVFCVLMVLAGCAVLGRFNFAELRLGRGETETLLSTVLFTAQILWLERPGWAGNHTGRVTLVMFATVALSMLPMVILHTHNSWEMLALAQNGRVLSLFLITTIVCSLVAFLLMNRWQPHVDATTAGIVYCAEPLFATSFALFLPAWLATWLRIQYENEYFTSYLVIGGLLITAANVLIALTPPASAAKPPMAVRIE